MALNDIENLKELAGVMRELGLVSARLADGTTATLGPAPRTGAPAAAVTSRSCTCTHRLSRHDAMGMCLERMPDGSVCPGPCELKES